MSPPRVRQPKPSFYLESSKLVPSISLSNSHCLYDNVVESLPEITFQRAFQDKLTDLFVDSQNNLLFLKEKIIKAGNTKEFADLFTKRNHNLNLPIIYTVQILVNKSKSLGTASLKSQYIILFMFHETNPSSNTRAPRCSQRRPNS